MRFIAFLSLLAASFGLYTIYGDKPAGIDVTIGIFLAIALLLAVIVGYGILTDVEHTLSGDGERVKFQYHGSPTCRPQVSFIFAPGMLNSGQIVASQFIDKLSAYGPVLVVNWPKNGFDGSAIASRILQEMHDFGMKNPIFYGQSLGSLVDMKVMAEYIRRGSPEGPIAGFMGDSAFTGPADVKFPAPPILSNIVRDLPLQSLYWPWIATNQGASGVRKMIPLTECGVDPDLVDAHVYALNHTTFNAVAAQGRYIVGYKAPADRAFGSVPAVFMQTPNLTSVKTGDVLLHEGKALMHLRRIFPDSYSVNVGGIHANAVERPAEHWQHMQKFIETVIASLPRDTSRTYGLGETGS